MANYKVPKGEEGLYHVSFYTGPRYDSDTREEIAKIQIHKTNPQQYKSWAETAPQLGIKVVEVLHDPTKKKTTRKPAPQGQGEE